MTTKAPKPCVFYKAVTSQTFQHSLQLTNFVGKTQIPFLKNVLQVLNNQIFHQYNLLHIQHL